MADLEGKRGCLGFWAALMGGKGSGTAKADDEFPYRLRDDFLSAAEHSFYGVLRQLVGERAVVCPKVNLADVLFVSRPNENRAARNRIDRKHVDFLLCDPSSMRPLAGIELDDASHQRPRRQDRDQFVDRAFQAAGLPLLRFTARSAYTTAELAEQLEPLLDGSTPSQSESVEGPTGSTSSDEPPLCPKCGVPMLRREAKRGSHAGQTFWGCPNYPSCRETVPVGPSESTAS